MHGIIYHNIVTTDGNEASSLDMNTRQDAKTRQILISQHIHIPIFTYALSLLAEMVSVQDKMSGAGAFFDETGCGFAGRSVAGCNLNG